jgi:hypothetical protein
VKILGHRARKRDVGRVKDTDRHKMKKRVLKGAVEDGRLSKSRGVFVARWVNFLRSSCRVRSIPLKRRTWYPFKSKPVRKDDTDLTRVENSEVNNCL